VEDVADKLRVGPLEQCQIATDLKKLYSAKANESEVDVLARANTLIDRALRYEGGTSVW